MIKPFQTQLIKEIAWNKGQRQQRGLHFSQCELYYFLSIGL